MSTDLFYRDQHCSYVRECAEDKGSLGYIMTAHMKMAGVYWGVCTLELLKTENFNSEELVLFIQSCYNEDGGFAGTTGLDSHILYTLYALQVLLMIGRLDIVDVERTVGYLSNLHQDDGSFSGDNFGEIDSRFCYCGVYALAILKRLDAINTEATVEYLIQCSNRDGGFGSIPSAESHGGYIFTAVACLAILDRLDKLDHRLVEWLICRQTETGGFQGRPEKLPDVCYSWWIMSAVKTLDVLEYIDAEKLKGFILQAQYEGGGISDRPGDHVDMFHTFFGIAGLSLLGECELEPISSIYAIPQRFSEAHGLPVPTREFTIHHGV
ncbi:hypothetical protein PCE1_004957 [Barthelona sp. PCE]